MRPLVGLAYYSSRGSPPDVATPSHHPLNCAGWSEGGSNIEEENGLAGRLGRAAVVVDHIAHLLLLPVHVSSNVPVVAVERGLGTGNMLALRSSLCRRTETAYGLNSPELGWVQPAHDLEHGGLGGHFLGAALEADQGGVYGLRISFPVEDTARLLGVLFSAAANLPGPRHAASKSLLPLDNLGPGALVQEVVDGHHALHCRYIGVCVALAKQGVVHLLGGRVLPVAIAGALGDGAWVSLDRKRVCLVGGGCLGYLAEHVVQRVDLRKERGLIGLAGLGLVVWDGA